MEDENTLLCNVKKEDDEQLERIRIFNILKAEGPPTAANVGGVGVTFAEQVFSKWIEVGNDEGLTSDSDIASFLIDLYEERRKGVHFSGVCSRCHAVLVPTCVNCQVPLSEIQPSLEATSLRSQFDSASNSHHWHQPGDSSENAEKSKFGRKRTKIEYAEDSDDDFGGYNVGESLPVGVKRGWGRPSEGPVPIKRGRGRPRKDAKIEIDIDYEPSVSTSSPAKAKRGRPRKHPPWNANVNRKRPSNDLNVNKVDKVIVPASATKSESDHSVLNNSGNTKTSDDDQSIANLPLSFGAVVMDSAMVNFFQTGRRTPQKHHLQPEQIVIDDLGNTQYFCLDCTSVFKEKSSLVRHMRGHTGERPFQCPECPKAFRRSHHLTRHKQQHSNLCMYNCSACSAKFTCKRHLDFHFKVSHENVTECTVCKQCFLTPAELLEHERSHADILPYACELCSCRFERLIALVKHRQTHAFKSLQCRFCAITCPEPLVLQQHMLKRHECHITCVFRCPQCMGTYPKARELKEHMQKFHPDVCKEKNAAPSHQPASNSLEGEGATHKEAGATYNADSSSHKLNEVDLDDGLSEADVTLHHEINPEEQVGAGKISDQKSERRAGANATGGETSGSDQLQPADNHKPSAGGGGGGGGVGQKINLTGEDADPERFDELDLELSVEILSDGVSFKCKLCDMVFTRRGQLLSHLRQTHTLNRPYPCSMCQMKFKRSYALKRHVLQCHVKARQSSCSLCGSGFSNADHLKRHQGGYEKEKVFVCKKCGQLYPCRGLFRQHKDTHTNKKLGNEDENGKSPVSDVPVPSVPVPSMPVPSVPVPSGSAQGDMSKTDASVPSGQNLAAKPVTISAADEQLEKAMSQAIQLALEKTEFGAERRSDESNNGPKEGADDEAEGASEGSDSDLDMLDKMDMRIARAQYRKVEEPIICHVCGKLFNHKSILTRHVRHVHVALRPFPCTHCDKAFKRNYALKRHFMQCHDKTRPEMCHQCGNRFGNADQLKRHNGGYEPSGQYRCKDCGEAFQCCTDFRKHRDLHLSNKQKKKKDKYRRRQDRVKQAKGEGSSLSRDSLHLDLDSFQDEAGDDEDSLQHDEVTDDLNTLQQEVRHDEDNEAVKHIVL